MRNNPKDAKTQQLVFFEDWERPVERLKGTAAILRKLCVASGASEGGLVGIRKTGFNRLPAR